MSGDHLVFISVAAVLAIGAVNTLVLNQENGWRRGENFWFWGMIALSASYIGFGSSAWFGRPALTIANASLLIAYLAMSLQLRFWQTGKTNGIVWLGVGTLLYTLVLEYLRVNEPYLVRSIMIHTILSAITAYLFVSAVRYYRKNGSKQLLVLSTTFAIEFVCASLRLTITVAVPAFTNQPMTLYEEPLILVVLRWVWLMANTMSFLTVMTFELEKILNKNETLRVLLKEKGLLLNALSRLDRSDKSAAIGRTLSHELRQPLTTLLLASKNLQAQLKDNDLSALHEQVDFLCHECERSANLINQLEAVFRPERVATDQAPLNRLIDQVIDTLKPRLLDKQISLKRTGTTECIVSGEPTQIETILMNLVSNSINALEHRLDQRQITIETKTEAQSCVVTVSDNGPGIDASMLGNLWQLYVTDEQAGSGIGLWLSQQIAHNHGGQIEAGNTPGSGAWFRVTLPNRQVMR
jgi:signal transduction histidine kinase